MALVVQNDTGTVDNANAYIDVAFADAYFSDRGNTSWSALSTVAKEQSIIKATDYIDNRFCYLGIMLTKTQTTRFPRENLYNKSCYKVEGIPLLVKKASAEYALRASGADLAKDPVYNDDGDVVIGNKVKVDVIEKDFRFSDRGGKIIYKSYPLADMLLKDFIQFSGNVMRG